MYIEHVDQIVDERFISTVRSADHSFMDIFFVQLIRIAVIANEFRQL